MRGTIKALPAGKPFGFISVLGKKDHFFHESNVADRAFHSLAVGMEVEFDAVQVERGPNAVNVRPADGATATAGNRYPASQQRHVQGVDQRGGPQDARGVRQGRAPRVPAHQLLGAAGEPPYNFVPIDIENAVSDEIRFHHGAYRASESLDGYLKVEWTTRTPTIVGHDQVEVSDIESGEFPNGWNPKGAKKALLPLRATWLPGQPVIWPGSSLKGMLRSAISSLLAAPMERVNERHYTYRPNLDQAAAGGRLVRKFGVVRSLNPMQVSMIASDRICFVKDSCTEGELRATRFVNVNATTERGRTMLSVRKDHHGTVVPATAPWTHFPGGVALHTYHHGADGNAEYASAFKGSVVPPHPVLAIDAASLKASTPVTVPLDAEIQWVQTAEVMRDAEIGHRRDHPSKDKRFYPKAGNSFADLAVGDALVVEVDGHSGEIVTFGHYFNYRVAYADSVRMTLEVEGTDLCYDDREEVRPLETEHVEADGGSLSGARGLFGYVEANHDPHGELCLRKKGTPKDFSRLAGRIACNHALEAVAVNPNDAQRFVGETQKYWLALKELGSPKPSAVEHYLDQSDTTQAQPLAGTLLTYGDSFRVEHGTLKVENRSARLRGRKVYPHQAALNTHLAHCQGSREGVSAANPGGDILQNDRAMLVRHVSAADTKFRSAIHYRDLRLWELGALFAAIEPGAFAQWLAGEDDSGKLRADGLSRTRKQVDLEGREFASKLGHGRPLGLGSVQGKVDGVDVALRERAFADLMSRLRGAASGLERVDRLDRRLAAWFRAQRYTDTPVLDYPTAEVQERIIDGQPRVAVQRIYGHHTALRREHAIARRKPAGSVAASDALPPLDELP